MLEHFVANFYEAFKGQNPPGFYTHMRNTAVEGSWSRGFERGQEEGYRKGYWDAKAEMMSSEEKAEMATQRVIGHLCTLKEIK
jgi:hypothetical protein